MGYEDPAFEGNRVTFTCLSGLILNGSNFNYQYVWGMENGNQTLRK